MTVGRATGAAFTYGKRMWGVAVVAQWLTNPTRNHEVSGSIPGLAQWDKDLWCRLQMRLGSRIAGALA